MAKGGKNSGRRKRQPLSRERIEEAALELIEREGLDQFSTRSLGQELGCEAMSIYHHFPSKTHLLDALVEHVIGGIELPSLTLPWKEQLQRSAVAYRSMARKYPRFFPYVAVHRLNNPTGLRYINHIMSSIRAGGFDTAMTARLFRCVGYYLIGAGLEESAGYAKGPSSVNPVSDAAIARDYPYVADAAPYFKPDQFDSTFILGLEMLIEGVETRLKEVEGAALKRRDPE